jgi:hypothetical protein
VQQFAVWPLRVRTFFEACVPPGDRDLLTRSFSNHDLQPLGLRAVVDALYDVRCDVVHEGRYWGFNFADRESAMLNVEPDVIVSIQLPALRDIIVGGCINAINGYSNDL